MGTVGLIAGKEIRDAVRNRWVAAATLLLAALAFVLTFLGSTPTGTLEAKPLAVTVVSLASLTIFLVPLIALLLSYDAFAGEAQRGTLLLLLTYPTTRWRILLGKFLGHTAVIAIATIIGYGAAGLAAGLATGGSDPASWRAFVALLATSIMLGSVFIAMAYVASLSVREPSTAAGIAIGLWLFFVLLFDLGLLGLLVSTKGQISPTVFPYLLLLDPADIFRLFNLSAFDNVRVFSGLAGLSGAVNLSPGLLLAALTVWIALPLGWSAWLFRGREL
ncbi:MAG: ABC transporter permease subunit [Magnetococcales bacterium]|nr:ABC transporter permease subunit [Magnetococcales bacterium]